MMLSPPTTILDDLDPGDLCVRGNRPGDNCEVAEKSPTSRGTKLDGNRAQVGSLEVEPSRDMRPFGLERGDTEGLL